MSDKKKPKKFAPKVPSTPATPKPSSSNDANSTASSQSKPKGKQGRSQSKGRGRGGRGRRGRKVDRFVQQEGGIFSGGVAPKTSARTSTKSTDMSIKTVGTIEKVEGAVPKIGASSSPSTSPRKKTTKKQPLSHVATDDNDDVIDTAEVGSGFAGEWLYETTPLERPVVLPLASTVNMQKDAPTEPEPTHEEVDNSAMETDSETFAVSASALEALMEEIKMDVDVETIATTEQEDVKVEVKSEKDTDHKPVVSTESHLSNVTLIQLPDILPVKVEDEMDVKPDSKATAKEGIPLNELPEGKLGQLRIRQSGKMELVIGDVVYEVSKGVKKQFLEQVACIECSASRNHMTCLGNVSDRLVVVPDIDHILTHNQAQS